MIRLLYMLAVIALAAVAATVTPRAHAAQRVHHKKLPENAFLERHMHLDSATPEISTKQDALERKFARWQRCMINALATSHADSTRTERKLRRCERLRPQEFREYGYGGSAVELAQSLDEPVDVVIN